MSLFGGCDVRPPLLMDWPSETVIPTVKRSNTASATCVPHRGQILHTLHSSGQTSPAEEVDLERRRTSFFDIVRSIGTLEPTRCLLDVLRCACIAWSEHASKGEGLVGKFDKFARLWCKWPALPAAGHAKSNLIMPRGSTGGFETRIFLAGLVTWRPGMSAEDPWELTAGELPWAEKGEFFTDPLFPSSRSYRVVCCCCCCCGVLEELAFPPPPAPPTPLSPAADALGATVASPGNAAASAAAPCAAFLASAASASAGGRDRSNVFEMRTTVLGRRDV